MNCKEILLNLADRVELFEMASNYTIAEWIREEAGKIPQSATGSDICWQMVTCQA